MRTQQPDTIFAPATGPGPAGVAIVRISGPRTHAALAQLTGRGAWMPRRATRVRVRSGEGETLDDALGLWFSAPGSFTGEDVAELHLHGGRAVVDAVLAALAGVDGLRPAGAGEFARRAFENGKMDLTQAEAMADLVAAETAAQRRQALRQLDGDLGALYEQWRQRLTGVMARLEAAIDFADEDLPSDLEAVGRAEATAIGAEIARHLNDGARGERIREGISIVLLGAPNVGKSSLLNRIGGREAAIVDAAPGTTRDVVEVACDVAGFPVVFADTAGLRDGGDRVEQEGVRRAHVRAATADIVVAVFDGATWPALDRRTLEALDERAIVVVGKADLGRVLSPARVDGHDAAVVSAVTGEGVNVLMVRLEDRLRERFSFETAPSLTRRRHRAELEACRAAIARVAEAASVETAAEELRTAAVALGRIVGRVDVEDVLAGVFREFCIGK